MSEKNIHDLFVEELQDIYHAEKQLTKALPKMARAANSQELREGFEEHLEDTYRQCERLEQIFEELGMRAKAKPCEAMRGLIEEASEMMREDLEDEVMDVALVSCAQKVEHYEIASYGTLVTLAEAMGHDHIAELLRETLEEEKSCDQHLTELAESEINPAAMEGFQDTAQHETSRGKGGNSQQRARYAEMQRAAERGTQQGRQSGGRESAAAGQGRSQQGTQSQGQGRSAISREAGRSTGSVPSARARREAAE